MNNSLQWTEFDMHCDGEGGCQDAPMNDGDNLYCGGLHGCERAYINSICNRTWFISN